MKVLTLKNMSHLERVKGLNITVRDSLIQIAPGKDKMEGMAVKCVEMMAVIIKQIQKPSDTNMLVEHSSKH